MSVWFVRTTKPAYPLGRPRPYACATIGCAWLFLAAALAAHLGLAAEPVWQVAAIWRQSQGLPQQTINGLLQSHDGYIWAATKSGLVRFDGAHFTVFDTRTTDQISC